MTGAAVSYSFEGEPLSVPPECRRRVSRAAAAAEQEPSHLACACAAVYDNAV